MKYSFSAVIVVAVATIPASIWGMSPATANPQASFAPSRSAAQALRGQLEREPGGVVRGNRIYYADHVFVAQDPGTNSLSQCDSGQFCIWSSTGYTGSFIYKTGQDVTRTIETSVGSFYNNRARAARLYSNTGASSICYAAQAMRASVSASYDFAEKVYLSDTTSC